MAAVGVTHHIKLGDKYLLVRPNTYTKSPAPTFGARITTGDPDYNNLSIWQHWVQTCWIGGMDADEWVDDAMYATAVGMDTTRHEKMTLSRHLKRGAGAGWTLGGPTEIVQQRFCVFKNRLMALQSRNSPTDTGDSRLYYYSQTSESWTGATMPGSSFLALAVCAFDGKFFVGGRQTEGSDKSALYYTTAPGVPNPVWVAVDMVGKSGSVTCMKVYNGRLYCAFETVIWRLKDDETWDGPVQFYKVNQNGGSNYITAMETHLGFLYMLSQNGHLHRTDGNNSFDIWSWDGQTWGTGLRSYDGKLFVSTYEYVDDTLSGEGVLYQFTGAAVTELKRWGRNGRNTLMGMMTVYDRRLFYGASDLFGLRSGFGIAAYDAIEDGHSIYAVQDNAAAYPDSSGYGRDWQVQDIVVFGGKMFCLVLGHGAFFTEDSFKDYDNGRAQYTTSTAGGGMTSSLYDGGTPGLMKLWRRITVWAYLPTAGTRFRLSYSTNDGQSWVYFNWIEGLAEPNKKEWSFYMDNVRSTDFKWHLTLLTDDERYSPIIRGISVAYLPQPEPNWMWSFVIPVSDKWELLDGTIELVDTNGVIAYLETLFRTQKLTTFTDIDGKEWTDAGPGALVYDINVVHYDVEQPTREADVRITLLETVEKYV